MNDKRNSFVFYRDWYNAICGLDDKTAIEVVRLITSYALGEAYESKSDTANSIMCIIRPQIERDIEKWCEVKEKRSNAGKKHKGNQYSKLEQNGTNGTSVPTTEQIEQMSHRLNKMEQNGTNGTVDVSKDTDVSIDGHSRKENVIEESITKRKKFQKPTVEEIRSYVREKNYHVDAEQFFNFYESKGWVVGKSPMKNWKAACATWERSRNGAQANLFDSLMSNDDMVINGQTYR